MSKENKEIDLNAQKIFFEPNERERFRGAAARIPLRVKKVADELDGKTISLRDAVEKIEAVLDGAGEVTVVEDCILLWSEKLDDTKVSDLKRPLHCWRVIKYR